MLKKTVLFLLGTLLISPLQLLAEPVQAVRIAFVNTARILEDAPQAQAARDRLRKEFAPRDAEITSSQRELKNLEDKLERDGPVMSDDQRNKLERDILTQQREVKRSKEAFTEDLNLRRNEEFARLQKEVADAIVAIAKSSGYDLILENGVVYASDRVDITEKVIAGLKKRVSAGTPAK